MTLRHSGQYNDLLQILKKVTCNIARPANQPFRKHYSLKRLNKRTSVTICLKKPDIKR